MSARGFNGGAAEAVIKEAIEAGAFPGAAAEAGTSDAAHWTTVAGALTYEPGAARVTSATLYDLASLTKVIATTSIALRLVDAGTVSLDMRAHEFMPEWREGPFRDVTVRDLLEHASGLAAWMPLYKTSKGRDEYRRAIASLEPEYAPRSKSIYSDLGFITLGFGLEHTTGRSLSDLFEEFRMAAALPPALGYTAEQGRDVAPTEFDPWRGRLAAGEVHDENAFALGGVAPHAGLFGTAADAGAFARLVLQTFRARTALGSPATMRTFATKSAVPESSRALGWDTMLPASSCGARMAADAIGHTGFTGTSLWIDHANDRYFVLLTNRVHPTRENNQIRAVRQAFHDALNT